MSKRSRGEGQLELIARSKRSTIEVEASHRLVQLTDRLDWDEVEARAELIRASKLKSAAGRGGNPAHQRVRGGAGGGGEVGRPESGGGGHDGAGSGDPVAERDGIAGVVFQLGGGGEQARRPGAEGIRGESGEQAEGGQGEGAQVSSLRQDEAGAAGAFGGDGEAGGQYAGAARPRAVSGRGASAWVFEGGASEGGAAARDDEGVAAADPLLAANGSSGDGEDHQPAYPGAVRDRAGQDREDGGIRPAVGDHPPARWISLGDAGETSQRAGGCAICGARGARPYPALWPSAACLCVRPRGSQPAERRGAQGARGEAGGTGPPRADAVGGQRQGQRTIGQGESRDRSRNRCSEERAIWLPPPGCALGGDDGRLWPARGARLD